MVRVPSGADRLPLRWTEFRMLERQLDRFIHSVDVLEIHLLANSFWNFFQIFLVLRGKENGFDSCTVRSQNFFFDPSHRKDQSPQRDLPGHGNIVSDREI